MPKICLDAGHNESGADTGAEGNGLREQDLTLDITRRLRDKLVAKGFEVVMTRDGAFVNGDHSSLNASLQTRCQIANAAKADLFIAIHINSGGGVGTEVYALPGGRGEAAAHKVLDQLVSDCQFVNRGVKTDRRFAVLVGTDMPAILTENGFIDSVNDANRLKDASFRETIAQAHFQGICDFYGISDVVPQAPAAVQQEEKPVFEALVVYIGYPEASIVPRLQAHLKAPAIMLQDLTPETAKAASKIYGVGYTAEKYVVGGYTIPLHELISGADADDTALEVIKYIQAGHS